MSGSKEEKIRKLEKRVESLESRLDERKKDRKTGNSDLSRRKFLKALGTGALSLGAISLLPSAASKVTVSDSGITKDGNSFWHAGNLIPTNYLKTDGSNAMTGNLGLAGNDLVDGATVIWDTSTSSVPKAQLGGPASSLTGYPLPNSDLSNSSITVTAGNQLTGGGTVSLGNSITIDVNEGSGSGLNADQVDGHNVFVQSSQPSNPSTNDIWFDTS